MADAKPLDIKLGQMPSYTGAQSVQYELQLVYNSLHILEDYLGALELSLQGESGGTDPSQTLGFRNSFTAVTAQQINTGAICCVIDDLVYNGCGRTSPLPVVYDSQVTAGSTGRRSLFRVQETEILVALETKNAGETIKLGVPSGVLKVTGAVSGQLVWAAAAKGIYTVRSANQTAQTLVGEPLANNGSIFLSNPFFIFGLPGPDIPQWEGYWLPGYPNNSNGTFHYARNYLFPVGVCIQDDYVLISSRLRDPRPVPNFPTNDPGNENGYEFL